MKRAVSVSLGSPSRDKKVEIELNGVAMQVGRLGTGGDVQVARRLFAELDGKVDALSVGGFDLYVHLEGRLFERAEPLLGGRPRFKRAFIPFGADRMGLIQAVSQVADEVLIGDLMFIFGVPYAVSGLSHFRQLARLLLPIAGYLPIQMLFPPGAREEIHQPKYERYWREADLIAGDMHYIRKYSPADLHAKTVITNTTTAEDIEMLRERGVHQVLTTTPIYEGRSFGVNLMEAVLTAYSGLGRPLSIVELNALIDELDLRPTRQVIND